VQPPLDLATLVVNQVVAGPAQSISMVKEVALPWLDK
jgi:hypothetical protein